MSKSNTPSRASNALTGGIPCPVCGSAISLQVFQGYLGKIVTEKKKQASIANGKLGGRPRKSQKEREDQSS